MTMTTEEHHDAPDEDRPTPTVTLPTSAVQLLDDVLAHRGWERREGQVMMVESIEAAIDDAPAGKDVDIATNAPVGTGKTLGYLLSALAKGERVVIATSTKSLQDQIVGEELPELAADLKALYGYDLTYGVLKGKSNYACLRTAEAMVSGGVPDEDGMFGDIEMTPDSRDVDVIKRMVEAATVARSSDDPLLFDAEYLLSELTPDGRRALRASKRCAGKNEPWLRMSEDDEAPAWDDRRRIADAIVEESGCIYRAAYAHCITSQVVVLNTTLLVYEIMKARRKFVEETPTLLNGVGVVVIDEGHHLARILADAFSSEVDFDTLIDEAEDVVSKLEKRYDKEFVQSLGEVVSILRNADRVIAHDYVDEDSVDEDGLRKGISEQLQKAAGSITSKVIAFIDRAAKREKADPSGLELNKRGVPKRVAALLETLIEDVAAVCQTGSEDIPYTNSAGEYVNNLTFLGAADELLSIKVVPVDVSFFRTQLSQVTREENYYIGPARTDHRNVAIMCSGTITAQTAKVVGMDPDAFVNVPSPFDSRRARLFVPEAYDVSDPQWLDDAWETVKRSVERVGGRTMILTTSTEKAEAFSELARRDLSYAVHVQGEASKRELVRRFKEDEESILVGTTSFWEGVDVKGPALSLVVIDRIPFPQPNDPVFEARRAYVKKHGGEPFMQVDVDHASIMMAQGAGRLIRDVKDVGGVMILDHRVTTKRYGASVLKLLPADWPMTGDERDWLAWLDWVNPETRAGMREEKRTKLPDIDLERWRPVRPPRNPRRSID